jgi:hypothetical protein
LLDQPLGQSGLPLVKPHPTEAAAGNGGGDVGAWQDRPRFDSFAARCLIADGEGTAAMPQRFESQAYAPETTKLMKAAFDEAWLKVRRGESDAELTRKLLASAILDQVNAGVQDFDKIVAAAVATLAVARNVSR